MITNPYEKIADIKRRALDDNVPIMSDDGIDFLIDYIQKNNVVKILEIGTAVGYSSIMMCLSNPNVTVTTIERDKDRYLQALKNVKDMQLEKRITLIFQDAKDVDLTDKYDLIFIDAAKGQNIYFFEKFSTNLEKTGTIITDNIYFHGLVLKDEEEIESRNLRGLVRKIKKYIEFLENNPDYETKFYETGDGISVSRKKQGSSQK